MRILKAALFWGVSCLAITSFAAESSPNQVSSNINSAQNSLPDAITTTEAVVDLFRRDTYRLDTNTCPFKGEFDYEEGAIECFLLEVPENREKDDSRYIELNIVKLNARTEAQLAKRDQTRKSEKLKDGKRPDPVVYLTGGPGAKAIIYVKRFINHGLLDHRDLYIVEQRGIGYSDDFCPSYGLRNPASDDVDTLEENARNELRRARDCAENALRAGVDLSGYNTIENARDVKALRIALGLKNWNVWGISYGSILGQAYAKEDEEAIRAIAIDAIMPLNARDDALHWRIIKWYDRVLKKLDEVCAENDTCADNYNDNAATIRSAIQKVAANPIEITQKATAYNPDGKSYVFADTIAFLPFSLFYEQSNYAALPAIIHGLNNAVENDHPYLFKAITQAPSQGFSISAGMNDAILCNDGGKDSQAASFAADREEFPIISLAGSNDTNLRQEMADRCREQQQSPRDATEYQLTETDLPALIIEGDMDPITPPPLAKVILPGFKNATYVEFPYAGHGPSRSVACAGDMLNLFYDNPSAEPDLSCVDTMKAPDFVGPLFETTLVPRLASTYFEDPKKLLGPGLWFGLPSLFLVLSFLLMTASAITRLVDGRLINPTDGARLLSWFTALFSILSLITFAVAGVKTQQASEILLLFGFVSTANWAALFAILAMISGVATIYATVKENKEIRLPRSQFIGFNLIGLSAITLWIFMVVYDLSFI